MAYPFAAAPNVGEFKTRLFNEFGCEYKIESEVLNEEGLPLQIGYFKRDVNGKVLKCAVDLKQFSQDEIIVSLPVVKSICSRLNIPVQHFGYTLN